MKRKGFTLIELMIVIAIIAILAAILVPNFLKARASGQITACKSNLKTMATALESYSVDNGGRYPPTSTFVTSLTSDAYLKTVPTCPSAGTNTYSPAYISQQTPDAFSFWCSGNNHVRALEPYGANLVNYPQYASGKGLVEHP